MNKFLHLVAGLAILVLVYFMGFSAVEPCPHPAFIDHHLCSYCHTLQDAATFSKYRTNPSGRNTVFFGHPQFEVKTYRADRCGNVDPVKVAVCTRTDFETSPTGFACNWMGSTCYGEHSLTTGHLYYRDIKCF